jgi:hypothetical protein
MRPASRSSIVVGMGALDYSTVFRRAVLDLSAEPTTVNVRRYLAASRLLDRRHRAKESADAESGKRASD